MNEMTTLLPEKEPRSTEAVFHSLLLFAPAFWAFHASVVEPPAATSTLSSPKAVSPLEEYMWYENCKLASLPAMSVLTDFKIALSPFFWGLEVSANK